MGSNEHTPQRESQEVADTRREIIADCTKEVRSVLELIDNDLNELTEEGRHELFEELKKMQQSLRIILASDGVRRKK